MNRLAPLLILCFSTIYLSSQNLHGRVVDAAGEPIIGASIFVKQTRQGLITNELGEFSIALQHGSYLLETSCLGFEKKSEQINITSNDIEKVIVLKTNALQLKEVVATAGEDPAYAIMRQAIKKAPYYQNVVKSSVYNAYSKGAGKMTDIPKLFEAIMNENDKKEMEMVRNKIFLLESFSEIKFTAPKKYEQEIMAFSSSFPMMDDPKNAMLSTMYSLYDENFLTAISPLNKLAFDYYRFRYEGFEETDNQVINKISVIPKLNDPKLVSGTLYIADNEWNIRNAIIKISIMGMDITYNLNYHAVSDGIYLVTDASTNIYANILGMKFEANLLSSIQFTDIQLNDSLIALEKANAPITKIKPDKKKKSLEIKREDLLKQKVDSLAILRDSTYWADVRKIVLTDEEQQSYARRHTLEQHIDSVDNAERNPKFSPVNLLTGGRIGNDSSLIYFSYGGVARAFGGYNFVDGFVLGQSFALDFKKTKNLHLTISPSAYYTTARQKILWTLTSDLAYLPRTLRGNAMLSFGRKTGDYSGKNGMNTFINTSYSLFYGENHAKLHDEKFARLSNKIDIANGLRLNLEAEIAQRNELELKTKYHFFGKKERWTPNLPTFDGKMNGHFSDLAKYTVKLTYTPEYYYVMESDRKRYVRSRFPTFTLEFQNGVALTEKFAAKTTASRFARIELGVNQRFYTSIFSNINYQIVFGKYLNTNEFNYMDYQHFETGGGLYFSAQSTQNTYALLPFYTFSTNKWWLQAFFNYNSDYILLKRLPVLQGKMFTERLHAKFLHTPQNPFYTEWGYSVSAIGNLLNAGVFVSLNKIKYNSVGIQIGIPIVNIFQRSSRGGAVTISTGGIEVEMK
jgi:hypothetical protein